MKKAVSIVMSLVFLISVMGMTINAHYCGTHLKSVGLIKKACCCDAKQDNNCCKDEITYIKVNDNFSASNQIKIYIHDICIPAYNEINLYPSWFLTSSSSHHVFRINQVIDRTITFRSLLI